MQRKLYSYTLQRWLCCFVVFLVTCNSVKPNYSNLFPLNTLPREHKTLPKAHRTRGLSSYHKFLHKFGSNLIFRMSNKRHIQNLNQTSASPQNFNFKTLTKPSFKISSKIQLHNLNQTSAAKYWPKLSFKISHELQLQNLDQTLYLKSEQKFSFMTKPQLPNLSINQVY